MLRDATVEPGVSAVHSFLHIISIFGFSKMVESHMNIGTDRPLSLHARLRGDFELSTVDVGFEFDALFGNLDIWQNRCIMYYV